MPYRTPHLPREHPIHPSIPVPLLVLRLRLLFAPLAAARNRRAQRPSAPSLDEPAHCRPYMTVPAPRPSSFASASAALLLCYCCCLLPPVPLPSAAAARGRAQFLTVLPASLDPQPTRAPSHSPLALSITMAMALRVRMCTAKRPADSLDMGLALV